MNVITQTTIESVLSKLRVKPGLHGERRPLTGPWRLGLWYDRERKSFALELVYGVRTKLVGLPLSAVETRGKSSWMADNAWRLTSSGIAAQAPGILAAIQATESKHVVDLPPSPRHEVIALEKVHES